MLTGGCLCGGVRYEISGEPLFSGHCHCKDCQKATGTGHVSVMVFRRTAVKVTGELKTFAVQADSGQPFIRNFCPNCGSLIYGESGAGAATINVAAGTLDDPSVFRPQFSIYTRSRQAWDHLEGGLPEFEAMPPRRG